MKTDPDKNEIMLSTFSAHLQYQAPNRYRGPLTGFRYAAPPITTTLAIVLTDHVLIMKTADNKTQYTCSTFMTPTNYGTAGYQLIANETAMR